MNDNRNPDPGLQQVSESPSLANHGKLKIFFGYAPGVGKTHAMLEAAHESQKRGLDVVVGYIQPDTSEDTLALLQGLELLDGHDIGPGSSVFDEFDLDGALRRNPELIIVDELAHSNAPASRHQKRYQDVRELLNAGIDVYTTVNVLDLESLNNVIETITKTAVEQRIPDYIFDGGNQVELVDIEPVELLERLRQGKIPAEGELGDFFSLDNLVALREIALRRMADWVNLIQEKNNLLPAKRPGFPLEHILVCLSPSPSNEKVIRQGARMAVAFRGKFSAFYVETPDFINLSQENRERLERNIHLAKQLGAKVVTSFGDDIIEQIVEYSNIAKVSKLVLGRSHTKGNFLKGKESFSLRLSRLAPDMEIYIVPDANESSDWESHIFARHQFTSESLVQDSAITLASLGFATLICLALDRYGFSESSLIMIYFLGNLTTALLAKKSIFGLLSSILSVLFFVYFFVSPEYSFLLHDYNDIVTLAIVFVTTLVVSSLTKRLRDYGQASAKKSYRTEILLETSHMLQDASSSREIARKSAMQLGKLLDKDIHIFLGNPQDNQEPVAYFHDQVEKSALCPDDLAVAIWTYKNNKHAGFSTTTLPGARTLNLAIRNGSKVFGVVSIDMAGKAIPAYEKDLMGAIMNECALALEKAELVMEQQNTAIKLEQEQLRANLLRSISHDLRTPLTAIAGSAGILIGDGRHIDEARKLGLYRGIYEDSLWLINLVENLLSVTRIENGTMELDLQIEVVGDVIEEALKHIKTRSANQKIRFVEQDELTMARMDAKLITQVIINLVDNAIKHTPATSTITIWTKAKGDKVVIEVQDDGPGIAPELKTRIFDMFVTGDKTVNDSRRGLGLGLALCKSIIDAHGGTITVADNQPTGTIFRIEMKKEEIVLINE